MAKTKSPRVVFGARLLHVVDNYLRRKQRGRGDMSALIYQALREVDLGSVQLITIQGQRRQVTARPTNAYNLVVVALASTNSVTFSTPTRDITSTRRRNDTAVSLFQNPSFEGRVTKGPYCQCERRET